MTRIKELEKLIIRYQDSYYNEESEISDAEFDKLWDELKQLDPQNSILKRVGVDNGPFPKAQHIMPMGSQEKAANPTQFKEWIDKHPTDKGYIVEYKLDGASLELQYEKGEFIKAVTRGNGTIGDDITENAKKIEGVLLKLPCNFSGAVRGEVLMSHKVYNELYSDKANCRNAANGVMKRKDGDGCQNLNFVVYDAWSIDSEVFYYSEVEKLKWLKEVGFKVVFGVGCFTFENILKFREETSEKRPMLDYDIDGLVIKSYEIDKEDMKRARPEKQIAFKFDLDEAITYLREVEWSKNGATYTPIAIFDPVQLNGTTVKRASLANPDIMKELNLRIGSKILVVKRGEIIPKIEKNLSNEDVSAPIEIPTVCEECGVELVNEGSRLYCPNVRCPKRRLHQLFKWVSVVDIRDFGETLITILFNNGNLTELADIYLLSKKTLTDYFLKDSSGKESLGADKVYRSIQSHKKIPLATFLAALDIDGFGLSMADKLIEAGYNTLDKVLKADEKDIASINGFAEITAQTLCDGLKENKNIIENVLNFVEIVYPSTDGKLNGKSFCFTGELSMKRSVAEKMVKDLGGSIKSGVTKDLTYLVTNDTTSGSSKNVKAAQLGIPVIDEEQFLELCK